MRKRGGKLSLKNLGIRKKLLISYALMSVFPIGIMIFIIYTFVSPHFDQFNQGTLYAMAIAGLISIILSWLGLLLSKSSIDPIIDLSINSRIITSGGEFDKDVIVANDDEVGILGSSINFLIKRVRDNMRELREYGEKTREINAEIQRKMMSLNDLLLISDYLSSQTDLDKTISVVLEKLANFYEQGFAICYAAKEDLNKFVMRGAQNIHDRELIGATIVPGEDFLGSIALKKKIVVIDNSTARMSNEYNFRTKHKLANAVIVPVVASDEVKGLLLVGNHIKEFTYTNEDVDTIKIFAKQLAIAVENQMLAKKAESLAIKDDLTGLHNRSYAVMRLGEEIERAYTYQRPCSLILFDIDDFKGYSNARGLLACENVLKKIAEIMKRSLVKPIDRAARIGDDEFALILPEKSKKQAIEIADNLKDRINGLILSETPGDKISVTVGVSENPLDGSTASQLLDKAMEDIKKCKQHKKQK